MLTNPKLDKVIVLAQQAEASYKDVLEAAESAFLVSQTTVEKLNAALSPSLSKEIDEDLADIRKNLNNAKTALNEFASTLTIVRETPTFCPKSLSKAKKQLKDEIHRLKSNCKDFKNDFKDFTNDFNDFVEDHANMREIDTYLLEDTAGLLGKMLRFVNEHTDNLDKFEKNLLMTLFSCLYSRSAMLELELTFTHNVLKKLTKQT